VKPEVKRILKLVEDGKLSSEDAAELIEAMDDGERPEAADPMTATAETDDAKKAEPRSDPSTSADKNPFDKLIEAIEKLSKDVSTSVDWNRVAAQVREGAHKGVEAVKQGVDQVSKGRFDFGWISGGESKDVELPLEVPAGKTLKIENPCGDIQVRGGSGKNRVVAHAKFKGATAEDAKAKAASYVLMIEESDSAVVIRQPDMSGLEVRLEVETTAEAPLEIRAGSGDIDVENMKGGSRINSKSGDVRLKTVEGQIEISSMSGDVAVEDAITTSFTCDGKSGDVRLTRVHGNVNLRTASGDVQIKGGQSRTLSVECVSGDCNVELEASVTGSVSLRTVSGDARLKMPKDSDCRVAISTLRGDAALSGELEDEARADQRITGRLGEGTGSVDVSAVTGDVTIELI